MADVRLYQTQERGYIGKFPCTKNRDEGTCGCSPVPKASPCTPTEARPGNFLDFLVGNLARFFRIHKIKAQTFREEFQSNFREEVRNSKVRTPLCRRATLTKTGTRAHSQKPPFTRPPFCFLPLEKSKQPWKRRLGLVLHGNFEGLSKEASVN